jgi:HTH-type transcriptional regulator/antitoxin HipB
MRINSAKDIGLLIREQRRSQGHTQQELAIRAGVGRQWLVAVEQGKARAELGLVLRVLRELGLRLDADLGESRTSGGASSTGTIADIDIDAIVDAPGGNP